MCLVRCQNPRSFGGVVPVQLAGGAGAGSGGGTAPITNSTTAAKGTKRPLPRRFFAKRSDLEKDSVDDVEQWQH